MGSGSRTCPLKGSSSGSRSLARDTLADFGNGLGLNEWLSDEVVAGLRPLLDIPVEPVLPTHGGPLDRARYSAR